MSKAIMLLAVFLTVSLIAGPAYAGTCGNPKLTVQAAKKLNKTVRDYSTLVLSGSASSTGPINYSYATVYELRANAQNILNLAAYQAYHNTNATVCPSPLPATYACDIYRSYYSKLRNNVNYLDTMMQMEVLPYGNPNILTVAQWHKVLAAYHQLGDVLHG